MSIGFFQEVGSEKKKREERMDGSLRGGISRECSFRMGREFVTCL